MRVCLHTPWYLHPEQIGGTERFLIDFAKELKNLGFSPFILCSSTSPSVNFDGIEIVGYIPDEFREKYQSIRVENNELTQNQLPEKSLSFHDLGWLSQYSEKQLRSVDADIIQMSSFASSLFIQDERPVFCFNFENPEEIDSYLGNGAFQNIVETVKKRESMLHSHSGLFTATDYYANIYSRSMNLHVLSLNIGTNISEFERVCRRSTYFENIEDCAPKILMPSRFNIKQKGQDIALKAAKELKERKFEFTMTFSGLNPVYAHVANEFLQAARVYRLNEEIDVVRFANMNEAYRDFDIVISPERYCSYGLSITESLALGIPTVLSNIPTYREIGASYSHALFFEVDAHIELADRIEEAVGLDQKLADIDTIRFRFNHDIRQCAKEVSQFYLG